MLHLVCLFFLFFLSAWCASFMSNLLRDCFARKQSLERDDRERCSTFWGPSGLVHKAFLGRGSKGVKERNLPLLLGIVLKRKGWESESRCHVHGSVNPLPSPDSPLDKEAGEGTGSVTPISDCWLHFGETALPLWMSLCLVLFVFPIPFLFVSFPSLAGFTLL